MYTYMDKRPQYGWEDDSRTQQMLIKWLDGDTTTQQSTSLHWGHVGLLSLDLTSLADKQFQRQVGMNHLLKKAKVWRDAACINSKVLKMQPKRQEGHFHCLSTREEAVFIVETGQWACVNATAFGRQQELYTYTQQSTMQQTIPQRTSSCNWLRLGKQVVRLGGSNKVLALERLWYLLTSIPAFTWAGTR